MKWACALEENVILRNFQLVATATKEEKTSNKWVIYIHKRQIIKLADIVGPYMHKSML